MYREISIADGRYTVLFAESLSSVNHAALVFRERDERLVSYAAYGLGARDEDVMCSASNVWWSTRIAVDEDTGILTPALPAALFARGRRPRVLKMVYHPRAGAPKGTRGEGQ